MEIKNFLPIVSKKLLCESIVLNSLVEKDGFLFIDYISRTIAENIMIVQTYTDLDVTVADYDKTDEEIGFDNIISQLPKSEVNFIKETVDNMLEQEVSINNSISGILNKNMQTLILKIPTTKELEKFIPKILKQIGKISPEMLSAVQAVLGIGKQTEIKAVQKQE